jgi:glycolate oxidase FAD binding subunit
VALARIEDFRTSVAYRTAALREHLGAAGCEILDDAASRTVWRSVRDLEALPVESADAVWRISVRPSSGPVVFRTLADSLGARGYLDWGGGLVWVAAAATATSHAAVVAAVTVAGGNWTLMRGPDALRIAVDVIPPEPEPLGRITRRVKEALDPHRILNPGRLYGGL